jgi:hypothetical protein
LWGTLDYVGTGVVTHVGGQLVDPEGDADATLAFRELGYAAGEPDGGRRPGSAMT